MLNAKNEPVFLYQQLKNRKARYALELIHLVRTAKAGYGSSCYAYPYFKQANLPLPPVCTHPSVFCVDLVRRFFREQS